MKGLLFLILMVIVGGACTLSPRPKQPPNTPFRSDGCSCLPDLDYGSCCVDHDRIYWQGGTPEQRRAADRALRECIAAKGRPVLGHVIYWGVRIGGHGWLPTPWRWGFGYRWPQGYFSKPLPEPGKF